MATDDYASRFATDILRIVVDGDHDMISVGLALEDYWTQELAPLMDWA